MDCPKEDHQHLFTVTDCFTGARVPGAEVVFGTHAAFQPPLWQEGRTGMFIVSTCCLGDARPNSPHVVHALMVSVQSGRTVAHQPVPQPRA